jgi:hypothetical protein
LEESHLRANQLAMIESLIVEQRRLSRWVYLLLGALSGLAFAEFLAWVIR